MRVTTGPTVTGAVTLSDGLFDSRYQKYKDGKGYTWLETSRAPSLAGQFVEYRFRNPAASGKNAFITHLIATANVATLLDMGAITSPADAVLANAGQQAVHKTGQAASVMSTTFATNVAGPFTVSGDILPLQANVTERFFLGLILTANSSVTWAGRNTAVTTTYEFRLEWHEE